MNKQFRKTLVIGFILFASIGVCFAMQGMGPGPGVKTYSSAAPTLSSRVISSNGTTLTLTGSESLSVGAGGNGGFDVDCATAGQNITATYSSGAPGTSLIYTLGTTVNSGDTCDLDYSQPGNGIEATTGGTDLASITSASITNNSTQGSGTLLVGDNTNRSAGGNAAAGSSSNLFYSVNVDYIAVSSGTLNKGYLRVGANVSATNVKMVVLLLSSGSTYNVVEVSSAATFVADSLMQFTFNGTHSITTGNHYIIALIGDGYFYVKAGTSDWSWMENSSGSYASPPTSVNTSTDSNSAWGLIEIYVTN